MARDCIAGMSRAPRSGMMDPIFREKNEECVKVVMHPQI
jgi:hypothetical protein